MEDKFIKIRFFIIPLDLIYLDKYNSIKNRIS